MNISTNLLMDINHFMHNLFHLIIKNLINTHCNERTSLFQPNA